MKKLLYILLILPFFVNGQGWEKNFGGNSHDYGWSVQQTTDGGYIICGKTLSFGNGNDDVWLIKTDSYGDTLWTKTFGGIDNDGGYSVQQTTDSGYIITGYKSITLNDIDVWLIKTDSQGNQQWDKTFGGTDIDKGWFVQQTNDSGYIITGQTASFGNGNQIWLIKTDSIGNQQWNQTYGGSNWEMSWEVQQTTDGGYIICGRTLSFGNGNDDVWLIKTDSYGDTLWTKTFDGIDNDGGYSVQQTTDNGYIITGHTSSFGNGNYDVYLIKVDGNGIQQWMQTFGGNNNNNDGGQFIQITTDGGYIICGVTELFSGNYNIYLIKTDVNGNITSTFNIPTPKPNRKLQNIVDVLGKTTKPKSNTPLIYLYDDGSAEKKLIIE